jgi:hypothetical protein
MGTHKTAPSTHPGWQVHVEQGGNSIPFWKHVQKDETLIHCKKGSQKGEGGEMAQTQGGGGGE